MAGAGKKAWGDAERLQAARKEVKPRSEFDRRLKGQKMLREALDQSLYYKSAFTERELDRALAENSIGKGLAYADMKAQKERFLTSKNAIELEGQEGKEFTTQAQLDLEEKLHTHTMNRWQDKSHTVNSKHLFKALSRSANDVKGAAHCAHPRCKPWWS